jgi:hypothetical protein
VVRMESQVFSKITEARAVLWPNQWSNGRGRMRDVCNSSGRQVVNDDNVFPASPGEVRGDDTTAAR